MLEECKKYWKCILKENSDFLTYSEFSNHIQYFGLDLNELYFEEVNELFKTNNNKINFNQFSEMIYCNFQLFQKIFENNFIIPNWEQFKNEIDEIINDIKNIDDGNVASYIPQLAKVDPNLFSVSICTIDGQRFNYGNISKKFCIQSCTKPITYLIALDNLGENVVHNFIGREPSGKNFNELCLDIDNLPHNPLINSGAIMAASLVSPEKTLAERFDIIMDYWGKLSGINGIGFDNSTYQSEKNTADRNQCLGFMMQEKGSFQQGKNSKYKRDWNDDSLKNNLDLYFQTCSIQSNSKSISTVAATLANGGINPITNEKVFSYAHVKDTLSLMLSCGMYDYSGEWAYRIGLPAKSGVSGLLYAVIPGVMGISIFSPKLDSLGNSVKGIAFFKKLVSKFSFHVLDNEHNSNKISILKDQITNENINSFNFINCASNNDLVGMKSLFVKGVDLNFTDYDGRSAAHLAASKGNLEVLQYLLENGANLELIDRWGNTPKDDSIREKQTEIEKYINENTNKRSNKKQKTKK